MYFKAYFTVGTMGDMVGFDGCVCIGLPCLLCRSWCFIFLNTSAPFDLHEHSSGSSVWCAGYHRRYSARPSSFNPRVRIISPHGVVVGMHHMSRVRTPNSAFRNLLRCHQQFPFLESLMTSHKLRNVLTGVFLLCFSEIRTAMTFTTVYS